VAVIAVIALLTYSIASMAREIGRDMVGTPISDNFASVAALGLLPLLWIACIVAIIAMAISRRRQLRALTGSIEITRQSMIFGTVVVPRTGQEVVRRKGRRLSFEYLVDGRRNSMNIPISWLTPDATERLIVRTH
jgi:hypothetical protein